MAGVCDCGNEHSGSVKYRGADNSLARLGRKQSTMTDEFDVHISYL